MSKKVIENYTFEKWEAIKSTFPYSEKTFAHWDTPNERARPNAIVAIEQHYRYNHGLMMDYDENGLVCAVLAYCYDEVHNYSIDPSGRPHLLLTALAGNGQGGARRLIQRMIAKAKQVNRTLVATPTISSESFYTKLGFVPFPSYALWYQMDTANLSIAYRTFLKVEKRMLSTVTEE